MVFISHNLWAQNTKTKNTERFVTVKLSAEWQELRKTSQRGLWAHKKNKGMLALSTLHPNIQLDPNFFIKENIENILKQKGEGLAYVGLKNWHATNVEIRPIAANTGYLIIYTGEYSRANGKKVGFEEWQYHYGNVSFQITYSIEDSKSFDRGNSKRILGQFKIKENEV